MPDEATSGFAEASSGIRNPASRIVPVRVQSYRRAVLVLCERCFAMDTPL